MENQTEEKVISENNEIEINEKQKIKISKEFIIEQIKRYLCLLFGLIIISFGVAFTIKAQLGTSPVSATPYVLSLAYPKLTVGIWTIIVNSIILLIQIAILRKKFKIIQLLQVPAVIIFGFLIDFANFCMKSLVVEQYWAKWLFCLLGILIIGVGVSFEVSAGVLTLPVEGLANTLTKVIPLKFGYLKVICDVTLVTIAIIISFSATGKLQGVREGTIVAAIFVGILVKFFMKGIKPMVEKFFNPNNKKIE